ncbi:hypothetical protein [Halanaeroarchaeum sulfurireducens]|uniref:Glycosyltransferase RgtA/B/C/D-like domain-containing protein n=1 Tax=Halanaeroarchaeum sulfurireducens TaxID=1604004 RepID=A0A0N9MLL1_9EURY|nr:hypothetical protein [Halanaeroarchaeum sulfurireducens]ALG82888.1 hypothetical protein HLASA_2013 [Halanaeroarchaeum sulfurireducens]
MYYAKNWELMYDPISSSPYLVTNYPPIYPVIAGTLNRIFDNIFFSSRLLSITSAISIAGLISSIVYKESANDSIIIGIISGLLFLFSSITSEWGMYARVDILGVCFGVSAIFWYLTQRGRSQLIGAALFSLLALFTKQSLFAAPAAIFLAMIFEKEFKRAIRFAVGLGTVGLSLLAGLTYVSEGQAWIHLVTYNQNSFSFYRMFATTKTQLIDYHPILLGIASATVLRYFDEIPRVLVFYFLTGGLPSLLVGKVGSGPNYFLRALVGMTILFGIFLSKSQFDKVVSNINSNSQKSVSVLIAVLVIIQFSLFVAPPSGAMAGADNADSIIEKSDEPILSEDSGLLVNNNQNVLYQPFIMRQLTISGEWNQKPVVQSIQNEHYEYIVLHFDVADEEDWSTSRWSPDQIQAVDENYQLVDNSGKYWVYRPKADSS